MILHIVTEILFIVLLVYGLCLGGRGGRKHRVRYALLSFLAVVLTLGAFAAVCYAGRHSVYSLRLPKGELHWTDVRPDADSVLLCVPAAYSDKDGRVLGQSMKEGMVKGYLHPNTGCTSLKGDMFYADYRWLSDEGFQQHTLVLDSNAKSFRDKRYKVRRALCKNSEGVFIVQSNFPMTLNGFANRLALKYTNAVNLDMGHVGYGFFRWHGMYVPLSLWTWFNREEQTNWLIVVPEK